MPSPVSLEGASAQTTRSRASSAANPVSSSCRGVARSQRQQIAFILDSLTDTLRVPLLLCDLDGYSYQEIGDQLQIGLSAVKMRIKRAREEFRRRWQEEYGAGPEGVGR